MSLPDGDYARLDKKLDKMIEQQSSTRTDVAAIKTEVERIADLDSRLRVVEKFQWRLVGICSVLAVILPVIVSSVTRIVIGE